MLNEELMEGLNGRVYGVQSACWFMKLYRQLPPKRADDYPLTPLTAPPEALVSTRTQKTRT